MKWFKESIWEIDHSQSLRYFAIFLSGLHLYSAVLWYSSLSNQPQLAPLCWGIWSNCGEIFSIGSGLILTQIYGFFAFLTIILFISKRFFKVAIAFLAISFVFKIFIYLSQFSLKANSHAFLFFLELCFLLFPQKIRTIKWLIVAYLTTTGILKLNPIWLSGYWMKPYFSLPTKALEWVALFTLLIEIFAPLGLMSLVGQIFMTSFVALIGYSLATLLFINFFDPFLYLGFFIFFPLAAIEQKKINQKYIYQDHVHPEASKVWPWTLIVAFLSIQVVSHAKPHLLGVKNFIFKVESPRVPLECKQTYIVQTENSVLSLPTKLKISSEDQSHCHEEYALLNIKDLCKKYVGSIHPVTIISQFLRRTFLQKEFRSVFIKKHVCEQEEEL